MNKLLTKIVGAALGVAMTVGVGVAVASNANKSIEPAHASGNYTYAATFDDTKTYYLSPDGTRFAKASISSNSLQFTTSDTDANIASVTFSNKVVSSGVNTYTVTLTKGDTQVKLGNASSTGISNTESKWKVTAHDSHLHLQNTSNSNRFLGMTNTSSSTTTAKAYATSNYSSYSVVYLFVEASSDPSISFADASRSVYIGGTVTQTATTANIGSNTVSYSSGDTSVATVNASTGEVTGVAEGSATITASVTVSGTTYTASYTVNVVTPTVSFSSPKTTVFVGQTQTNEAASNPSGETISYSSGTTSVATVNASTGEVTGVAEGTSVITASATIGGHAYSGNYTMTVRGQNSPFTVAQARAAIDGDYAKNGAYVSGIVSEIVTAYDPDYGNITYNISADGETSSDQLQAFRGKSYGGADFSSANDIQVGDEVVVYGTLKKYKDTYEFDAANQLVSLHRTGSFSITNSVSNATLSSTANVAENDPLDITIIPATHYSLPNALTSVTMGGNALIAGSGYTYNSSTGAFYIASVTGDVVITGACVEDAKYTVTYTSGANGGGTDYVVSNVYAGSYSLVSYATASTLTPNEGYRFKAWSVGGVEKDPGTSITISGNTTVTAVYEVQPLSYPINFGATKNTNPTEIKTDEAFHTTYSSVSADVVTSDHSKVYGISSSQLKCGSGSATASITFTIPSDRYITSFSIVIETAGGTSLTVTSGAANAETETKAIAVGTLVFDDYLATEQSNSISVISVGNGAFYVSSMTIDYAYKTASLAANPTTFDMAVSTSQNVTLTPTNITPSSYTAAVQSGSSLTASSVAFNGNTATVTAGVSTGTTVIRITGTQGTRSAYVDLTITVTQPRNLTGLSITTASDATTFKVGQTFDVGSLVITATFDAEPLSVTYSKANANLGVLTFDPELDHVFTESDIGTVTVTAELTVGEGYEFVGYDITVTDKPYAAKVTAVSDLWDGQQIYFGNASKTKVNSIHTGGSNLPSQNAVIDNTKGLSLDDLAHSAAYTVHREKIDGVVYYSFQHDGYYLCASSTAENWVTRTDELNDNCRFTISIDDGEVSMINKGNSAKNYFRWNEAQSYFSCFPSNTTMAKCYIYAVTAYGESAVASSFEVNWLHMNDYAGTKGQPGPGYCKDEEHAYYAKAKAVWQAMSEYERAAISEDGEERLAAWAAANGDTLDSNMDLVSASRVSTLSPEATNVAAIVAIVSVITLSAVAGYFMLRKRKEQ